MHSHTMARPPSTRRIFRLLTLLLPRIVLRQAASVDAFTAMVAPSASSAEATVAGAPRGPRPRTSCARRRAPATDGGLDPCCCLASSSSSAEESSEDPVRDCGDEAAAADEADSTSKSLHEALARRVADLGEGIGRRYACRTQLGFLNVHEAPGDPFDTDNVVGRLLDGQIVASTGPPQGAWIQHDGGGWSISVYEGFVWLEELEE